MTTTWKLVPDEPTPEMRSEIAAGLDAHRHPGVIWGEALAAAPPPPETVLTFDQVQSVLAKHFGAQELSDDQHDSAEALVRAAERAILRKLGGGV